MNPKSALKVLAEKVSQGRLKDVLEAKTPPATTPRGGKLFPDAPMYTPDVPQVDLPRMKGVDVARAAGKKPKYTERMQSLLDSPTVRKKVDKLIEKGDALGMREWYGTEPLRQAAMEAGVSPEQYRSFMAQLASASQRNPVDQQNLMGSFLYHLQQSGQLPENAMLLTNKAKKQFREDPSLAEGRTLIELPSGYGSLAQSSIFERGLQIANNGIEYALPPEAKLGTFYRNLLGNLRPVTVDVNAVRGPVIEQGDPRWLTSKLVEKDEEGNIKNVYFPRRMVEEGDMSIREAKQRPGFWEAAPSGSEYAGFEDLWQRAARRHDVEPAEAQALGWYGSGDVTALKTKPELYIDNLERLIRRTAEIEGENPLQTMNRILRGETFLKKAKGGSVDTVQASPQNPYIAPFARGARALQELAGRYQVLPQVPLLGGTGVDELLGLNDLASLTEDVSYYGPRALIKGGNVATGGIGTFRPDPRVMSVVDFASNVAPVAALGKQAAVRGGKAAGRALNEAMLEGTGPFSKIIPEEARGAFVIKPKGGNWVAGGYNDPRKLIEPLTNKPTLSGDIINEAAGRNLFESEYLKVYDEDPTIGLHDWMRKTHPDIYANIQNPKDRALNSWLDKTLLKYIKNEMGTPEDRVRLGADAWGEQKAQLLAQKDEQIAAARQSMEEARQARGFTPEMMTQSQARIRELQRERDFIAEQRGTHLQTDEEIMPEYAERRREDMVYDAEFLEGLPSSYDFENIARYPGARAWEDVADSVIFRPPYSDQAVVGGVLDENLLRELGGQFAVDNPDALAYALDKGRGNRLGFSHMADELRNALDPESGLPPELLINPDKLAKMSVADVSRHVDKINAWRGVQTAEANRAIAGNAATHLHKEYTTIPGTEKPNTEGMRWVELKMPEASLPEGYSTRYLPEVDMWGIYEPGGGAEGSGATLQEAMGLFRREERGKTLKEALKYEGDTMGHCVGGYCEDVQSGNSRIFSLRDESGKPHVTVEFEGQSQWPLGNPVSAFNNLGMPYVEAQQNALERIGIPEGKVPKEFTQEQREKLQDRFEQTMRSIFVEHGGKLENKIKQIKGKRNRPPIEQQNFVLDFLRDQPNAQFTNQGYEDLLDVGIVDLTKQPFGIPPGMQRFVTKEEFNAWADKVGGVEKYAKGGAVSADYDPDLIDQIVSQFDAEGSDYDYETAIRHGMSPDETGHWGSRVELSDEELPEGLPKGSGVMLKGAKHETWDKALAGEEEAGYDVVKRGDRYYSVPKDSLNDLNAKYAGGGIVRKAMKAIQKVSQDEALKIAQKNAAKPVSKGGLGLRPDNTPMERARAMGYEGEWYHGTQRAPEGIKKIKGSKGYSGQEESKNFWMTSSPESASRYANWVQGVDKAPLGNPTVYPLMVGPGKDADEFVFEQITSKHNLDYMPEISLYERPVQAELRKAGYTGMQWEPYGDGEKYRVVNRPSRIRSRFAAFDPARIDESDLLAGFAALGIAAPMLTAEEQKDSLSDLDAKYAGGGIVRRVMKAIQKAPQDEALKIAQKNAAKPVSEGGLGLHPDNTPMERAKAMGYGEPMYRGHQFGTGRNKNTFYSSSPDVASAYAVRAPGFKYEVLSGGDRYLFESLDEAKAAQQGDVGGKVRKLKDAPTVQKDVLRSQNPLVIDAEGANWQFIKNPFAEPDAFENLQKKLKSVTKDKILNGRLYTADQQRADILRDNYHKVYTNTNILAERAKDLGYDSITIKNLNDVPTSIPDSANPVSDVSIVLEPKNIRSRFAAFDPARIDENNLLAGFAALGITAPMLTSEEPKDSLNDLTAKYAVGGPVRMAGGGIGKNVGRGMAGLTRSRQELDPKDIQAMMLDVPAGIGVPFAEAGAEYLRGNIEDAETSAAIDAALTAIPAAALLAKPAYRAAKKAVPAVREAARGALERGMESGAIVDPRMPVIAYHGTPHRFEKFDASKIGTGEGAQAYGHGIYFAEALEVAKTYAIPRIAADVESITHAAGIPTPTQDARLEILRLANSNKDEMGAAKSLQYASRELRNVPQNDLAKVIKSIRDIRRPSLYTVDIPDESVARMLDWDKPLRQQTIGVQEALNRLPANVKSHIGIGKYDDLKGGIDIFKPLGGMSSDSQAAALLRQQGIPGIRYLDAGSRSTGQGTSNFVVFPGEEETVKILERKKRGGAVTMAKGGAVTMDYNPADVDALVNQFYEEYHV